ncbi:MAG: hypothetical protein M3Z75_27430 [Actinomycetota bacterium]|nr:hypothetical protein [Actinomycetota bacterium]
MDAKSSSSPTPGRRASWIIRLARRVGYVVSEMHFATRRASALMFSYGLVEPDRAPDTYAEFLLRTPASWRHEPTAQGRATGDQIR